MHTAFRRIEAALARIDAIVEGLPRRGDGLADRDDRVRREATVALSSLDELISELEP